MNLLLSSPSWVVGVLFIVIAAAAVEDALRLRISNWTCLAVFLLALIAAGLHGLSPSLWQNLLTFLVLLLLGTFAFSAGALGGGDVKLLASLGLWLDIRSAIWFLAAVLIAGGVLALLLIAGRLIFEGPVGRSRRKQRIPYGIAIAAGAIISFTAASLERSHRPSPLLPVNIVLAH